MGTGSWMQSHVLVLLAAIAGSAAGGLAVAVLYLEDVNRRLRGSSAQGFGAAHVAGSGSAVAAAAANSAAAGDGTAMPMLAQDEFLVW